MKNLIKNHGKSLLTAGLFTVASFCWLPIDVFSASEATRRLIHETLAKYGISAGGKRVCGTDEEPFYDESIGKVKCYNNNKYFENNCWDAESRLCKTCPFGKVVSKTDFTTCRQIICPEGYKLVEVINGECPNGFELKPVSSCGENFDYYSEIQATQNYTTTSTNCKNIK